VEHHHLLVVPPWQAFLITVLLALLTRIKEDGLKQNNKGIVGAFEQKHLGRRGMGIEVFIVVLL